MFAPAKVRIFFKNKSIKYTFYLCHPENNKKNLQTWAKSTKYAKENKF